MCPTSIAKHLVTGTRQDVMVVAADGKNLELILSSLVVMGKQYGRIPIIAISADDEIIGDERLQWIKPDFEPHQLEGAISTALSRRPLQQA